MNNLNTSQLSRFQNRSAKSFNGVKSLKNRILKRLHDENVSLSKRKKKSKRRTSFFTKTSVRTFLDKTCEMKNTYVTQKMLEDELSRPKLRMNMRNYFENKLEEQSQGSILGTRRALSKGTKKTWVIPEVSEERRSQTYRLRSKKS